MPRRKTVVGAVHAERMPRRQARLFPASAHAGTFFCSNYWDKREVALGLERFTDMARTEAATFALVVLVFLRCVPRSSSSGSRCGTMPLPCAVAALHANPGGQVQGLFLKAPAIELASMSTLPAISA